MRAIVLGLCLTGCILGCSRQVEVVDTAEQKAQRDKAAETFDKAHYADLSQPLGAEKKKAGSEKEAADKKAAEPPKE